MKNWNRRWAAAFGWQLPQKTGDAGRGAGRGRLEGGRLLALSLAAALALPLAAADDTQAQQLLQISGARRTVMVTIAVGKTEDVRVDVPFSDITVGDPEVADVAPLTDHTLSILGKKIGTTRVTVLSAR